MPKLAAQLLTMHRTDTMRSLLLSLKAQTEKDFVLYWLDNGSTDEEYAKLEGFVREIQPDFEIVAKRSVVNTGFDGGHQSLFELHDAEFVSLINDDAILEPDFFARCLAAFAKDAKLGAVSGVILRWHFKETGEIVKTNVVDSMGLICRPWQMVVDRAAGKQFAMPTMPHEVWKAANGEVDYVFGVSGCLPVYRRVALGGQLFDPAYFFYKEDVDVAYRLRNTGWKTGLVYAAKAYHQRTFKPSLFHRGVAYKKLFCSYRNHLWNLRKHLSRREWLKYGVFIIPFELAKAGFLFVTHPTILWKTWTGKSVE